MVCPLLTASARCSVCAIRSSAGRKAARSSGRAAEDVSPMSMGDWLRPLAQVAKSGLSRPQADGPASNELPLGEARLLVLAGGEQLLVGGDGLATRAVGLGRPLPGAAFRCRHPPLDERERFRRTHRTVRLLVDFVTVEADAGDTKLHAFSLRGMTSFWRPGC